MTTNQSSWSFRSLKQCRIDNFFEILSLFLMVASIAFSPFRYLTYTLPAFALIVILANRQIYIPELAKPYLILLISGLILSPNANSEGIKDLYLILAGLSVALVGHSIYYTWRTLFLICVVIYILSFGVDGFAAFRYFSLDFTTANRSLASSFSFVFGVFAIWATHERKWQNVLFALLFTVLAAKRIAIIGALICIVMQLLPSALIVRLLRPMQMLAINIVIIMMLLAYGSGELNYILLTLTGKSANAIGLGRQVLYSAVVAEYFKDPLQFLLVGAGPGQTYDILKGGVNWHTKENLHSDLLKIVTEYGAIVFTVFFWVLYSSRKAIVLIFALYANILFLTDNTLIYPFFIYFLIYIAMCISEKEGYLTRKGVTV